MQDGCYKALTLKHVALLENLTLHRKVQQIQNAIVNILCLLNLLFYAVLTFYKTQI